MRLAVTVQMSSADFERFADAVRRTGVNAEDAMRQLIKLPPMTEEESRAIEARLRGPMCRFWDWLRGSE